MNHSNIMNQEKRWLRISTLTLVIILFIIGIGLFLYFEGINLYPKRILWTDLKLRLARRDISKFRDIYGRNPQSLIEINEYAQKDPNSPLSKNPYGEFISNADGNRQEHRMINGNGGFFYDPNNGEVRVNLSKPIKHYMRLWIGKKRNEIPSEW